MDKTTKVIDEIYETITEKKNWDFLESDEIINLENPYKLEENIFKIEQMTKFIDILTGNYAKIIKLLKNINENNIEETFKQVNSIKLPYKQQMAFDDIVVRSISLAPFDFSIPSVSIEWTNLFTNFLTKKFTLVWNTKLFDSLQIKIERGLDINVEIKAPLPAFKFTNKGHRIYLFDLTNNAEFQNDSIIIELIFKDYDNNKDYNGSIDVAFNQIEYRYDIPIIQQNIRKINDELLDLIDNKNKLENEKIIAETIRTDFQKLHL